MKIDNAKIEDCDNIMSIYSAAREYMQLIGNGSQWINGYPNREIITEDISLNRLYVCKDDNDEILAVFCYFIGEEPSYNKIFDGDWLDSNPYGVVHRMASSGKVGKIADYCLEWCFQNHPNIRIDTHKDNKTMREVLKRNGYIECGTISLNDGSSRIASQKTVSHN